MTKQRSGVSQVRRPGPPYEPPVLPQPFFERYGQVFTYTDVTRCARAVANVPKVDEEWGNKLWDAVKKAQNETTESVKPPLVEVDFDQKMLELQLRSDNYDGESENLGDIKAKTLKTLPSYQGEYEAASEVCKIPSQKLNSSPKLDIANLTALMSAPIRCTLPMK